MLDATQLKVWGVMGDDDDDDDDDDEADAIEGRN